jgi:sigma-B regulation protein RsbU (phosphoserine phosphatase)
LKEVLQGFAPDGKPQELLQRMTEAVSQFVEEAEQSDDLTMLAIRYSPETEKDVLDEALTLKNDLHQINVLSSFVKDITGRLNLEPKLASNVRLAVEEAVVNVMDYAYPVGLEGDISISAKSDGKRLKFIISDEGVPFDPTKALQVDTTLAVEDRPVGGLGIHLVRQLMDSINYERIDGKNTLTLRKEIIHN